MLFKTSLNTPLGEMIAVAHTQGISLLAFSDEKTVDRDIQQIEKTLQTEVKEGENAHMHQLKQELEAYFNGDLKAFTVPLFTVGTPFQKSVWEVLQKVPYGETKTYAQQALALDKPKAVRAVANANGQNKIAIVIPCHRIIGSNGTLTGYAGGLWRKQKLLELEKSILL